MEYYYLEPEVAGGLGEQTRLNYEVHPPEISKLHYHLEDWLGDAILESFPAFILTAEAQQALQNAKATGIDFAEVEVTVSECFRELNSGVNVPPFVWLRPNGIVGRDDFGTELDGRLVVSERALGILRGFGTQHARIEKY